MKKNEAAYFWSWYINVLSFQLQLMSYLTVTFKNYQKAFKYFWKISILTWLVNSNFWCFSTKCLIVFFSTLDGTPDEQEFNVFHDDYQLLKRQEKQVRRESINRAARGDCNANSAITQTDAARGLRRIGYHVWRIIYQLREGYRSMENSTWDDADSWAAL